MIFKDYLKERDLFNEIETYNIILCSQLGTFLKI